jgi:hypothetical protein
MIDKLELGIFVAALIALVVCGIIFTRRPTERPPSATQHNERKPAEPLPGG